MYLKFFLTLQDQKIKNICASDLANKTLSTSYFSSLHLIFFNCKMKIRMLDLKSRRDLKIHNIKSWLLEYHECLINVSSSRYPQ